MRYVDIPDDPDLATLDRALAKLRLIRKGTRLEVVQGWIDQDIDAVLDLRLALASA